MPKAHTFTRWDLRPLSPRHKRYAADDVRYLPAIAQRIRDRLEKLGHARYAEMEYATVCDAANFIFDADVQVSRVNRSDSLKAGPLAVLRELVMWRDRVAREVRGDQSRRPAAERPAREVPGFLGPARRPDAAGRLRRDTAEAQKRISKRASVVKLGPVSWD